MRKQVFILCSVLVVSGCTRCPQADDGQISSILASRVDKQVEWFQGCPDDLIKDAIHSLLEQELSSEAALQIALLNNPKVQSIFEKLGIAHADLVEAGLLSNPDFSLEVRYPHQKNLVTNIEYLVTATFLDIFLIPLRTKFAEAEFEQVKRRVTHEILELTFEVRQTYYELLAAWQKLRCTRPIVELASINSEIVVRQHLVGNVIPLDLQQAQARFLSAQLEMNREQAVIIHLKEKLNRLLGLDEEACLILPELPEELDYQGFNLCALEPLALASRMDLQEARFEVIRLSRMLGLKEWWTYTNLKAGVAGERDPDGLNLVGFGVSGEIPIFNYGQAARLRLFAELRQAQNRYAALEIKILSEVREAHQLLMNDLVMIQDYRVRILPLQNEIMNSSEGLYNVMGLGIDRLLENKRQELEAKRNYIEILKDYWVARVLLDKAVGGDLFRLLNENCISGAE